jgi:hypothetical protein
MATTRIYRSISSSGTTTKATYSAWVKRSGLAEGFLFLSQENANNNFRIRFNPEVLNIEVKQGGSNIGVLSTNRVFRDTSAWYHIVVALDSTLATADDRMKLYVNGVQETSFSSRTNPSQNANMSVNEAGTQYVGSQETSNYFDGSLTHVHYVDGTAYAASTFGETDSTSGIWTPKTAPSVTYGTNGFFLKFENSANMDLDSSGNNLTFTTGGTLTQNTDTPTNNVCVWNRNFLTRHHNESTSVPGMLQNGNTTFNSTANAFYGFRAATIAITKGKWYWENKIIDNGRMYIGICYPNVVQGINTPFYDSSTHMAVTLDNSGSIQGKNGDSSSSGVSFANNDIIGFALDMDNKGLYVHKNGTYVLSGNPASGASLTGSVIEPLSGTKEQYLGSGDFVSPFVGDPSSSGTFLVNSNFGSGFFGTTAVASANADANGHGAFEYAVPSGYYTLNTKNLKEFG